MQQKVIYSTIQVANIATDRTTEGPGVRTTVWLQGCSIGRTSPCVGCHNSSIFGEQGGERMRVDQLADLLHSYGRPVTLMGGEPTDQAFALGELLMLLSKHATVHPIIVYSGYTREEVVEDLETSTNPGRRLGLKWLFQYADILVDGRFDPSRESEPVQHRGSGNQNVYDLRACRELNPDLPWTVVPPRLNKEWDRPRIVIKPGGNLQIPLELAQNLGMTGQSKRCGAIRSVEGGQTIQQEGE